MNTTPIPYTVNKLRILSLNTHKCYEVLIALLNSTDPKDYDVLCIQEPPPDLNKYPSLSSPRWDRVLPTFRTSSPDTLLYINNLFLPPHTVRTRLNPSLSHPFLLF
ncbi:hypothetical protein DFH09DRAFT_943788 [Mycena vulgaris]|nr:hypothetical protein DFH09DRAFT_943788 [Mycena vulgaris]